MFTSALFVISWTHTEFFNCAEYILYILIFHRVKRCCIFIFTDAERWVLTYSIIVSRIYEIHELLWKLRFGWETIAFSRAFYMSCRPRNIKDSRHFSNHKQNTWSWNLSLHDYRDEHNSYLQGAFQLVTFWFR